MARRQVAEPLPTNQPHGRSSFVPILQLVRRSPSMGGGVAVLVGFTPAARRLSPIGRILHVEISGAIGERPWYGWLAISACYCFGAHKDHQVATSASAFDGVVELLRHWGWDDDDAAAGVAAMLLRADTERSVDAACGACSGSGVAGDWLADSEPPACEVCGGHGYLLVC